MEPYGETTSNPVLSYHASYNMSYNASCSGTPTAMTWASAGSALHPLMDQGVIKGRHTTRNIQMFHPAEVWAHAVGRWSQDAQSPKRGPRRPWESCHPGGIADLVPGNPGVWQTSPFQLQQWDRTEGRVPARTGKAAGWQWVPCG